MINKYKELHAQFLDLVIDYHNTHVKFLAKPNKWTSRNLVRVMMKIGKLVKEIKKNNLEMREELIALKRAELAVKKEKKTHKGKQKNVKHS